MRSQNPMPRMEEQRAGIKIVGKNLAVGLKKRKSYPKRVPGAEFVSPGREKVDLQSVVRVAVLLEAWRMRTLSGTVTWFCDSGNWCRLIRRSDLTAPVIFFGISMYGGLGDIQGTKPLT